MVCLFTINKKGNAILRKEALTLCPEFAYLTEQEVLCIILAYDYYSIYRQFPEDERRRRARAHVFAADNEKFFELPKIKKAIELYKSLQYDHRRNQIIAYKRRLQHLDSLLESVGEDDLKKLKDVINSSKELRHAIKELEQELLIEEEEGVQETESNTKLSFLEKLQSNKERYKEITAKKPDAIRGT